MPITSSSDAFAQKEPVPGLAHRRLDRDAGLTGGQDALAVGFGLGREKPMQGMETTRVPIPCLQEIARLHRDFHLWIRWPSGSRGVCRSPSART